MSRVAKNPISVPKGVDVTLEGRSVKVKGPNGDLGLTLYPNLEIRHEDDTLRVEFSNDIDRAMAGTTRSLIGNMITGVTEGFQKKLTIVGVGYRAQAEGAKLNLSLGFSHPVVYKVPGGVSVETPTQTEVLIKGADKQKVGQVAAEIRGFRPPEPYKGKGIRYSEEHVRRKQAKKI
ncbi:MAG TPA: 50S ribosomal protein L6 [Arenicellales bacterium]|jgi:large subunit ribosomal protein L6|uniref:Large ribosomal subunit protein uL6 alpha-beta domain-containing protein n=1 Tax=marine metagenome TaxID=408172 RepID=A0A381UMW7_9ZZZZ|nr:50S ribosomal protein L6 [Acidiferrobacteraceae bacterium]MDP6137508.1 50S ribosomal protein L6 [Arenicellales bacterium]HCF73865.1 50S ribosomal protein L6 [Gammaproteobacteria bacterium]HJP08786.1 50S ribosomal protein L6 [Arenicellales bacterium]|tara:strand:- start:813 stop:1340 length:528 start_codon:yes stop_codon:yes gene_type:complete